MKKAAAFILMLMLLCWAASAMAASVPTVTWAKDGTPAVQGTDYDMMSNGLRVFKSGLKISNWTSDHAWISLFALSEGDFEVELHNVRITPPTEAVTEIAALACYTQKDSDYPVHLKIHFSGEDNLLQGSPSSSSVQDSHGGPLQAHAGNGIDTRPLCFSISPGDQQNPVRLTITGSNARIYGGDSITTNSYSMGAEGVFSWEDIVINGTNIDIRGGDSIGDSERLLFWNSSGGIYSSGNITLGGTISISAGKKMLHSGEIVNVNPPVACDAFGSVWVDDEDGKTTIEVSNDGVNWIKLTKPQSRAAQYDWKEQLNTYKHVRVITTAPSAPSVPSTGDRTPLALLLGLMAVSAVMLLRKARQMG